MKSIIYRQHLVILKYLRELDCINCILYDGLVFYEFRLSVLWPYGEGMLSAFPKLIIKTFSPIVSIKPQVIWLRSLWMK
jgi:hypothetical protein